MSRKAQLFGMDILIAISIALLMATVSVAYWTINTNQILAKEDNSFSQRAAFDAANVLVELQLVDEPNVFNRAKLLGFVNSNYNMSKETISVEGFEYLFKVTDTNQSTIQIDGTPIESGLGFATATDITVVRRAGVYEGEEVLLFFYLWN